jgi:small-conductance mechanosensitive channel
MGMALEDIRSYIGEETLNLSIGGNLVIEYLAAFLVFLLSIILLKLFKHIIVARLKAFAKRTRNDYDDLFIKVLDRIGWPFYAFLSFYIAFQMVVLPEVVESASYVLFIIFTGYYLIRSVGSIIDFGAKKLIESSKEKGERTDKGVVSMLANLSKLILWAVVIILIVSNLGYDTSALLTGLGIGGIAVALALQTVLSDIFAYFSIHLDKPFRVGDLIVIGSDMGTVEKIGIKTTRIRTLQGQELVVSNKELTESRINNYKRMAKRRIQFSFSVGCETSSSKLKKIPRMVKSIIGKMEHAQFDRAHFKEFSDFALMFEVVYYMTTPDYNSFMDTQQAINVALMEELEKQKISMPYPTQTIHLSKRS